MCLKYGCYLVPHSGIVSRGSPQTLLGNSFHLFRPVDAFHVVKPAARDRGRHSDDDGGGGGGGGRGVCVDGATTTATATHSQDVQTLLPRRC